MGRAPCCDKANVKRGPWSPEEDAKLKDYISNYGTGGNWIALPHKAGLKRCGKSCRLRWLNYLRPNIKHGEFSDEEDRIICTLFATIGSRWSIIAAQLPGRTDNDIKNYWNTKLKKKLITMSNTINPNFKANNEPAAILHNSAPAFMNGPNYYNAPSYLTPEFDQAGSLVNSSNQQDGGYFCPTPMQNNYLVAAGAREPSSSSDDGSYNNHYYQYQGMSFQNSESLSLGEAAASMGYGIEEIRQLISTNTSTSTSQNGDSSNSNSYSFYFDEKKTEEGAMMYY